MQANLISIPPFHVLVIYFVCVCVCVCVCEDRQFGMTKRGSVLVVLPHPSHLSLSEFDSGLGTFPLPFIQKRKRVLVGTWV